MEKKVNTADHMDKIASQSLFHGFSKEEIAMLLKALSGELVRFRPGEKISMPEEYADSSPGLGLLLEGWALYVKYDVWGNRSVIDYLLPGFLMGSEQAFGRTKSDIAAVQAEKNCLCLYVQQPVPDKLPENIYFLWEKNIIALMAERSLRLLRKADILSHRTLREKVLAYLSREREIQGGDEFTIPMNRQELSDYLYVDRTSLSSELGKLRREGILDFEHNHFYLLNGINGSFK